MNNAKMPYIGADRYILEETIPNGKNAMLYDKARGNGAHGISGDPAMLVPSPISQDQIGVGGNFLCWWITVTREVSRVLISFYC
jgi:hypothetical protein